MNRTMHEIEPEELMAYLDGELEASRGSEVVAHIAACTDCSVMEADLRRVSANLVEWQVEAAPEFLAQSIGRSLTAPASLSVNAQRRRKGFLGAWHGLSMSQWGWKFGVACVALLLLSGLYTQRVMMQRAILNQQATGLSAPSPLGSVAEAFRSNIGREQKAVSSDGEPEADKLAIPASTTVPDAPGPMIARTATMNLVVAKLDAARASLEKLLARHHGFASEMTLDQSNDASASLNGTLQVPTTELNAMLAELRGLGRVTTESQGGEDVSDQHVDLAARLHNARESETRLLDILRTRTGKVGDVLEVEEQISKTRGEIEEMEAQLAGLDKRVAYASIKLQMGEEYKAPAGANGSVALRLRNAVVGGYRDAVDSLLALAVFLLSAGPTLLIWAFILFWPARAVWKRRGALRAAFGKG
jgi:Domain of unknown function (DUF4349)/Putative zinc-finger